MYPGDTLKNFTRALNEKWKLLCNYPVDYLFGPHTAKAGLQRKGPFQMLSERLGGVSKQTSSDKDTFGPGGHTTHYAGQQGRAQSRGRFPQIQPERKQCRVGRRFGFSPLTRKLQDHCHVALVTPDKCHLPSLPRRG